VLLNNGDGTFAAAVDYPTKQKPGSVAIGDLDGDGKPDLAVGGGVLGTATVFLNASR